MATFNINKNINFTYTYGETAAQHFVEGEFYSGPGNNKLGVKIRVERLTREEAVDSIHRLARHLASELETE